MSLPTGVYGSCGGCVVCEELCGGRCYHAGSGRSRACQVRISSSAAGPLQRTSSSRSVLSLSVSRTSRVWCATARRRVSGVSPYQLDPFTALGHFEGRAPGLGLDALAASGDLVGDGGEAGASLPEDLDGGPTVPALVPGHVSGPSRALGRGVWHCFLQLRHFVAGLRRGSSGLLRGTTLLGTASRWRPRRARTVSGAPSRRRGGGG